ncbi:MAG: hypothetical protein ACK50P_16860 [Planctomycetaceae bacterium]
MAILSEFTIPSVLYGKVLEQISATRGSGTTSAGKLAATDTFAQSSYVQWQTTQYTDCCFAASQRVYKLIPASGAGTSGTNYDETDFGYDVMRTGTESGLFAKNQIAANPTSPVAPQNRRVGNFSGGPIRAFPEVCERRGCPLEAKNLRSRM